MVEGLKRASLVCVLLLEDMLLLVVVVVLKGCGFGSFKAELIISFDWFCELDWMLVLVVTASLSKREIFGSDYLFMFNRMQRKNLSWVIFNPINNHFGQK